MTKSSEKTPAPVLSVRGLSVSFRGARGVWSEVVRGLDLEIGAGETVALVGESGSGKSVTSMAITRLLDPETSRLGGSILLDGQDLLALSEEDMVSRIRGQKVAMIFQEPMTSLHPIYTIGDQITEALTVHSPMSKAQARKQAIELMQRVRIPNAEARISDFPHAFSGGMRQRVMIAMALASRPKLLIADEPTTALDVTVQGEILDLLKDLQEEFGMAMLFITHDMGVVAEVADRTVVMLRGDMVESGTTAQIFDAPVQPYTKGLLASVPKLGTMRGEPVPLRFPVVNMANGSVTPGTKLDRTPDTAAPLLKIRDLVTRFDMRGGLLQRRVAQVHAVEDVSFDIYPGETLSLVGESGCGKSTTGKSLIQLSGGRSSGSVDLSGTELFDTSGEKLRRLRRRIQMIPQDPLASLSPRMTISEALTEPFLEHRMGSRAEALQKAERLMRQVGLQPDMLARFPHEFSGGQRQRLCVARALMLDPEIIIADESVSALDVSVKAQVVNLLMDIQQNLGIAFLFISHDIAVVERISHRIAVMYLGEIVEIGPRSAIMERPAHPYTRRLIEAVAVPDPSRRHSRRSQEPQELKTPLHPMSYVPPKRRYIEIAPGHLVRDDVTTAA
ncbi:MAG: ABC transporter ATP-binding protein [Rhodobacterales bacterium]